MDQPPRPTRRVPLALWSSIVGLGVAIVVVVASLVLLPAGPSQGIGGTSQQSGATAGGLPSGVRDWGPAPAFSLPTLTGGMAGPARWRGRPLVVAFWASWCAPCRAEAPVLVQLARRYGPRGMVVVAVDVRDLPGDARRFVRAHGFSFPVVSDPSGTVAGWYGVAGLPTLALIGRNGHLLSLHPGPLDSAAIASFVAPAWRS